MPKYRETALRKLARGYKWQLLYSRAKELSNIRLFKNEDNFTKLQLHFLNLLENISSLYMDLAMKEPYIDESVIIDEIRSEAYLFYKNKQRDNKKHEPIRESDSITDIPSISFTSRNN